MGLWGEGGRFGGLRAMEGRDERDRAPLPALGPELKDLEEVLGKKLKSRGSGRYRLDEIQNALEAALSELADEELLVGPPLRVEARIETGAVNCYPRVTNAADLRAWARLLRIYHVAADWRLEIFEGRLVAWTPVEVALRVPSEAALLISSEKTAAGSTTAPAR